MSFSQYGEDDIIAERLQELCGGVPGKLLEIGAWDPITFSNSRLLIEKGWSAILIEPSPGPVKALAQTYADNARVAVISAAVTVGGGLLHLMVSDDAVTTPIADEHRILTWKESGGFYGSIFAPSIAMQALLTQFGGNFQFVSIDTEGTSVPLFIEMLRIGPRPRVVMVEHDNRIVELNQYAEAARYQQIHINGTNWIGEWRG